MRLAEFCRACIVEGQRSSETLGEAFDIPGCVRDLPFTLVVPGICLLAVDNRRMGMQRDIALVRRIQFVDVPLLPRADDELARTDMTRLMIGAYPGDKT